MEKFDWISSFIEQWPSFAWLIPLGFVFFYLVKFIALSSESVTKALGGLGKHWRESAELKRPARQAEVEDLRAEVKALAKRLDVFHMRDQMYWSYIMKDAEFHYADDLQRISEGKPKSGHISFYEFRTAWLKERGLDGKEIEF